MQVVGYLPLDSVNDEKMNAFFQRSPAIQTLPREVSSCATACARHATAPPERRICLILAGRILFGTGTES